MVPVVTMIPYSLDEVKKHVDGPSLVPGARCIREGVVIRPFKERNDPRVGRVILKYVGDNYIKKSANKPDFKDT